MKNRTVVISAMAIAMTISASSASLAYKFKTQSGMASVYSTESGTRTASGRRLNPSALTAAHRTLPFGTKVRVTNKRTGRSAIVTITDRGPFVRGRIIDLTPASARAIGMGYGVAPVVIEVIGG